MPILKHKPRHIMLRRQRLKHILRRGNSFALSAARGSRQSQVREQHHAKLLGRIDVESLSSQLEDALAYPLQFHAEPLRESIQHALVDAHASVFHAKQNRRQRQGRYRDTRAPPASCPLPLSAGRNQAHGMAAVFAAAGREARRCLPVPCSHIGECLRSMRRIQRVGKQHGVVYSAPAGFNSQPTQQRTCSASFQSCDTFGEPLHPPAIREIPA